MLLFARLLRDSSETFCLHTVRQLQWWRPDRLVGVVSEEGAGQESVVEFAVSIDKEKGSVEIAKW